VEKRSRGSLEFAEGNVHRPREVVNRTLLTRCLDFLLAEADAPIRSNYRSLICASLVSNFIAMFGLAR